MRISAIALCPLLVLSSLPASAAEPTREELKQQVKQLKAEIKKLSAVLEGSAKPMNLGRTDFAAVTSSGSNGGRSPLNIAFGVRNAFDGGENWHGNINYTNWHSIGGRGAFIEVRFDQPVTVTAVSIEGGPSCTPTFTFQKGDKKPLGAFTGELKPTKPLRGVTGVKLTFGTANSSGNVQVNEVRVMGFPPPKVKYNVSRPRLILKRGELHNLVWAELTAAGLPVKDVNMRVTDHKDRWEAVFFHIKDKVDLLRVTVFKRDTRVETKRLAKWTAIKH